MVADLINNNVAIFKQHAAQLADLGYSPLPIWPGEKRPAVSGWQTFCDEVPTFDQLEHWVRHRPRACGVGTACGIPVGDLQVVAVDLDIDDFDELELLKSSLPPTPMAKRGRKGLTLFYRAPPSLRSATYKTNGGKQLADFLAKGRQTVLPPSIHPATGRPYEWRGRLVPAGRLPMFDDDARERFEDSLRMLGWDGERCERRVRDDVEADDDDDSYWGRIKSRALADLSSWVPLLGLTGLVPSGDGGYRAVATWTQSGHGLSDDDREPTLSIHTHGIVDFGDMHKGYDAIGLVAKVKGQSRSDAASWLWCELGFKEENDAYFAGFDVAGQAEGNKALPPHDPETGEIVVPETPHRVNTPPAVPQRIKATPFVLRDPRTLPRRQWVMAKFAQKREVSVTVSPGGVGKTTLSHVEAIALAAGKRLLHFDVPEPQRVWIWNGEEPFEEMERRIGAISLHYGIDTDDLGDRLFLDTEDDFKLVLTVQERYNGPKILTPVVDELVAELKERQVDLMIVDPFVSTHNVTENDNNAMQTAASAWKRVAKEANCAIHLVHHTRKSNGQLITSDSARGGDALVSKARAVRPLNPMSDKDAKSRGVAPDEARGIFWYDPAGSKANCAPRNGSVEWFKLIGVPLWNESKGEWDAGDEMQVVVPYRPPAPVTPELDAAKVEALLAKLRSSQWKALPQAQRSPSWVGVAIADAFGLDTSNTAWQGEAKAILRRLIEDLTVYVVEERDVHTRQKMKVARPWPTNDNDNTATDVPEGDIDDTPEVA